MSVIIRSLLLGFPVIIRGGVTAAQSRVLSKQHIIIQNRDFSGFGIHIDTFGYVKSGWVQLDGAFLPKPIAMLKTKTPWTNEKLFEGRMEWIPNGDYLREELIYSGKSGQTLKAIYR